MKYWLLNATCGLLILVLLGAHMAMMHLDMTLGLLWGSNADPLSWNQVALRGESRTMTIGYVVLLGAALFHGLYGLHTVLTEFLAGQRAARLIRMGCWATGILLFLVGTASTLIFHQFGSLP